MSQLGFHFDGTRCTGCKTCVFACKDLKNLGVGKAYRHVYEYTGGQTSLDENGCIKTDCFSYTISVACNHCEEPACAEVCPTKAMHKRDEDGLVVVDPDRCIGCGYCEMACPYNNPKVDREKGHSTKCDGCYDLVENGEKPACVEACPALALQFGPVDELLELGGAPADIAPLPPIKYTSPNLLIIPSVDAKPAGDTTGYIGNPLEVQ